MDRAAPGEGCELDQGAEEESGVDRLRRWGVAVSLLVALTWAGAASAFEWTKEDFTLRVDSLVSVGASIRTQKPDCRQIASINGGCNPFAEGGDLAAEGALLNQDDGNLNWKEGDFFSVLLKGTHDVEARWLNYSAFVRFNWFLDAIQIQGDSTRRTPLTEDARFRDDILLGGVAGAHFEFLDAYLDGGWSLGDRLLNARVGNQVINWGESLFQQGGLNSINTLDVTRIRLPGSELREALLPAPFVKVGGDIIERLGFEFYYQFGWRSTELDPVGTFFSTNDLVSRGAQGQFNPLPGGVLGCGDLGTPDANRSQNPLVVLLGCVPPYDLNVLTRFPLGIPFLGTDDASDQGQLGAALRYYIDAIETELAVYYVRLHHKFPLVEFSAVQDPNMPSMFASCQAATPPFPTQACNVGYAVVYPENVDLIGLSFNTVVAGIAFGGEFSYRIGQPTPVTFDNSLCSRANPAACNPAGTQAYADQTSLFTGAGLVPGDPCAVNPGADAFCGGGLVPGFVETDRLVAVGNALWIFSPGTPWVGRIVELLRANDMTAIGEFAVTHYPDLDQCPAGAVTPNCRRYPTPFGVDEVDDTGWGYTLRLGATYDRILGLPISFLPVVSLSHDAGGITPPSEAGFNEGVLGFGVSLEFQYLERWSAIVSYSNSFGAGIRNGDNDRDFAGATLTYRF
jgi:hypothetical protein